MQPISRRSLLLAPFGAVTAAMSATAAPPDASEILAHLEQRLASIRDYSYVLESDVRGPKKRSHGVYQIWVRKPNLFRLKVERGDNEGSEIAVTPRGKVDARPGGFLKHLVTRSMEKTDDRLRSPRGQYAWESTFTDLCARLRESLGVAGKASVASSTRDTRELTITLSYRHPRSRQPMREIWTVDTADWMLRGLDVWEDGLQVEKSRFRKCRVNLGLKEQFFDL